MSAPDRGRPDTDPARGERGDDRRPDLTAPPDAVAPDLRDTSRPDPTERADPEDRRRVPAVDQSTAANERAQRLIAEVAARREAEQAAAAAAAEREAEDEQLRAELARTAGDEDDRQMDRGAERGDDDMAAASH